ncbi:MAG TPA: HAMP domain-containing sensor histidine kinase [Polyangiaceae bacterium]|jgi:signal transduction histidine kinase|nr:HAMP domain-containing sensor histidine kinase [Polyangiaceae bacterium]
MIVRDPLQAVELLALLEEATTPLRHDVRNRIAAVRNLAFFVRRKLATEVVPDRDPRVPDFLLKIEGEVQRTDEVIEAWSARLQEVRPRATERVRVVDCLRLAIACTRLPSSVGLELAEAHDEELELDAERDVLAFAVRCLIENSGEAMGAGLVRVSAERAANQCRVTVSDHGPGIADAARCLERFETTKPGHLGLGLCMARRIASRLGGDLLIGSPESGAQVSLVVPLPGPTLQQGAPA